MFDYLVQFLITLNKNPLIHLAFYMLVIVDQNKFHIYQLPQTAFLDRVHIIGNDFIGVAIQTAAPRALYQVISRNFFGQVSQPLRFIHVQRGVFLRENRFNGRVVPEQF
jgi:hypothetical protein